MEIDPFTLIAQIANFLILVALLKYFLYGRIIKVMDERERRIASRLEEAERKRKEAEQEAESYHQKEEKLMAQKEEMLSQAKKDTEVRRKELMNTARDEIEEIKSEWYGALERQKSQFLDDLRRRTGERVCAIARRALEDLANDELEEHIVATFVERIGKLSKDEKEAVERMKTDSEQAIVLRSTFETSDEMQKEIRKALQKQAGDEVEIRFDVSPDLICGIELDAHGQKIAWSLDSYLGDLGEDWLRALEERSKPAGKRESDQQGREE